MGYERVQLAVDLSPNSEEPRRKIEALRYVPEALGGPNATKFESVVGNTLYFVTIGQLAHAAIAACNSAV